MGGGLPFRNPFAPQNSRIDNVYQHTVDIDNQFRSILSEAYAEYGMSDLVDQPVADAFRTGTLLRQKLDDSQKKQLYYYRDESDKRNHYGSV